MFRLKYNICPNFNFFPESHQHSLRARNLIEFRWTKLRKFPLWGQCICVDFNFRNQKTKTKNNVNKSHEIIFIKQKYWFLQNCLTPFLKLGFRYRVLLQYSVLSFGLRVYSNVPTWIISWWRRASCSISSWYVLFSPCPTRNTTFTFFIVFASSPQEPLEKEVYQLCCINCETEPWYT